MLRLASPAKGAFGPIRVHQVLDHSLRLVQRQLEGRGIELHRAYRASSDLIGGDDYQLEQAFLNIFLNALEAMGNHGELFVTTEEADPGKKTNGAPNGLHAGRLQVCIRDTGSGIAPQNMAHLFEPFFTTKQNGTGLGLLITRRIIEEHRGTISVQSEPNHGATFSIEFPALNGSNDQT
jgi:two-component system sensor histidine kinase HydH